MSYLNDRKFKFTNRVFFGKIEKCVEDNFKDNNVPNYLGEIDDIEYIDSILTYIEAGIINQLPIKPIDVSSESNYVFIRNSGFDFMDGTFTKVWFTVSLLDMKELFLAWREFLLTPPLNGSKV
jgi:hypothetical protein